MRRLAAGNKRLKNMEKYFIASKANRPTSIRRKSA